MATHASITGAPSGASSDDDDLTLTRAHRDHVKRVIASGYYANNAFGYEIATFLLAELNKAIAKLEAEAMPVIVFDTDADTITLEAA